MGNVNLDEFFTQLASVCPAPAPTNNDAIFDTGEPHDEPQPATPTENVPQPDLNAALLERIAALEEKLAANETE